MYRIKRMAEKIASGMSGRMAALVLALTMIAASAAGGTLAWMYSGEHAVKNTFTVGSIAITLQETDTALDADGNVNTNLYEMGVGTDIAKDPTVTVLAGSADCWLYVQLSESENFAAFMEYAMAEGWQPLADAPGVYWQSVNGSAEDQLFPVLEGNVVHMKAEVTLDTLATLEDPADYPTLTFKAWAVQRAANVQDVSTAESAWQVLQADAQ